MAAEIANMAAGSGSGVAGVIAEMVAGSKAVDSGGWGEGDTHFHCLSASNHRQGGCREHRGCRDMTAWFARVIIDILQVQTQGL